MEEKKYLKWYNKVGYGSGDVAGNVVYAFLSFVILQAHYSAEDLELRAKWKGKVAKTCRRKMSCFQYMKRKKKNCI